MIYISLEDSKSDPTYTYADNAILVESDVKGENPCVGPGVRRTVSVLPMGSQEIRDFADIMGWTVQEVNGKLVLDTGTLV
jgi:hypothetical protein